MSGNRGEESVYAGARVGCLAVMTVVLLLLCIPWSGTPVQAQSSWGDILLCDTSASGEEANNQGESSLSTLRFYYSPRVYYVGIIRNRVGVSISPDGRYVAFSSSATNLVPGDTNGKYDVFRKDLETGAVVLCSTPASGATAKGSSDQPSISADGRYVAFASWADDLVAGDSNGKKDVFRKDLETGELACCSNPASSAGAARGSDWPSISADGRYVAYCSDTNKLVAGDTDGMEDIFLKDFRSGRIKLCSNSSSGGKGNMDSRFPSISANGRYVAFSSNADNLIPHDSNDARDVFRKDMQTGAVIRCSSSSSGTGGEAASLFPSISSNGRSVAFPSYASNLVPGGKQGKADVYCKDTSNGGIVRCSTSAAGTAGNDSSGVHTYSAGLYRSWVWDGAAISPDGRYVSFASQADNLVTHDENGYIDVFRKDLQTGAIERCDSSSAGIEGMSGASLPCLSSDGRYVAFRSYSANLVPEDDNNGDNVFRKELGATTFYFAEGTCRPGFDPYLCIQNPGGEDAAVRITYMKGDGTTDTQDLVVPGKTRSTVTVRNYLGEGDDPSHDFSARVECTNGQMMIAERPMYFAYKGAWTGGHDVVGTRAPASTFYFAEGTCRPGFDPYLCIQNPGGEDAAVKITYMKGDGTTDTQDLVVPGNTRSTVTVREKLGTGDNPSHDFSAKVQCTNGQKVVAERPMYFNYKNAWTGGHDVVGTHAPETEFYFAEGTCRPGFDSYLCIQNPGSEVALVTITYMKGDGTTDADAVTVPGNSRYTVTVKNKLGEGDDPAHDFSSRVECTNGQKIIAERPMYFNYKGAWTGGHDVVGAVAPSSTSYFAEGTCRPGFDPYFCIQNPGDADADVTITYMKGDGSVETQALTVGKNSRSTVIIKDKLGEADDAAHDFSARVDCAGGQEVIVERPMYFNYKNAWTGGHDVVGFTP